MATSDRRIAMSGLRAGIVVAGVLLAIVCTAKAANAATYTPIPGTRVELVAPPGFVIARGRRFTIGR